MHRLRFLLARSFFVILATLACTLTLAPVLAQTSTAPIRVDGYQVFEVSQSGNFSAKSRAEDANSVLQSAVRSSQPPQVEVVESRQLPVIRVNGRHLLTVTGQDAPTGRTAVEQSQLWAQRLRGAIEQAHYQRTPAYFRRALFFAISSLLGAIALHWSLGWVWQRWLRRVPKAIVEPKTGELPEGIELVLQSLLTLARAGVWLAEALYIGDLFPYTRQWNRQVTDSVFGSLTSPGISLGESTYSIIDLVVLIGLFLGLLLLARSAKKLLRSRVLRFTGMNRGAQEAIAFIAHYTLIFVGTVVLLQLWGLDLSSLTILASVLGVGIGLGLQGIAKEFVSGLVIIFERPIQVGDFVEVGKELMGTVERISVRSTEIRTLDQVSIIIPNSRFLETEVVNWSHGSSVSRLKLPLSVAYGTNLTAVRLALIEAAKDHPNVLKEPAPRVFFKGFGDSALEFDLLVWITEPREQFEIKSDLYFRIETVLRHRHIEIPFPQQDLHLRSGGLPVELSPKLEDSLVQLSAGLAAWLKQSSNGASGQNPQDTSPNRDDGLPQD